MSHHSVYWQGTGKEPKEQPDPGFPEGIDLDVSAGANPACMVQLPYPAKRIGFYLIECQLCGSRVACTTAGRVDGHPPGYARWRLGLAPRPISPAGLKPERRDDRRCLQPMSRYGMH